MRTIITVISTAIASILITIFIGLQMLPMLGLELATSASIMALKASKDALEKVKEVNAQRKADALKRAGKKVGKRIAAGAVAGLTVGAVAVVGLTSYSGIQDYCENLEYHNEIEALSEGRAPIFDFDKCAKDTEPMLQQWREIAIEEGQGAWREVKDKTLAMAKDIGSSIERAFSEKLFK